MKNVLVICNPFAGGGTAKLIGANYEEFSRSLTAYNFHFYYTGKPRDFGAIRNAISDAQPSIISIVGGDGTVNEVLNVTESHTCSFHLVPAGSGNDFHRLVYGNLSIEKSIEAVVRSNSANYDIGICNDQFFLNGVGVGFDGSVARETMRMKVPFVSSKWKYWIAIFKNILFFRSIDVEITTSQKTVKKKMFMIAIANGTDYGGGFKISPESNAQDGLLNLVMIDALSPIKRLLNVPKVQAGKHLSAPYVNQLKVKKVTISAVKEIHAHLDGEQMSSRQFDIEIQPSITFVV